MPDIHWIVNFLIKLIVVFTGKNNAATHISYYLSTTLI